jgi:predicted amidohydrolase
MSATIAILQMEVAKGQPEVNLDKVRRFAREAHQGGSGLLLLPELWSSGFAYHDLPAMAATTPAVMEELSALSRELGLAFLGTLPEEEAGCFYNTMRVCGPDGVWGLPYRKVHLFRPMKEDRFFSPGNTVVNCQVLGLNLGLAICFDLRFPELMRKLAVRGAHLLAVPAQWPRERREHLTVLARARAIENQCFVAVANTSGRVGRTVFAGHSLIVHPDGRILALAEESEGLIAAEIDPGEMERLRGEISYLGCRAPDVDEFLTTL